MSSLPVSIRYWIVSSTSGRHTGRTSHWEKSRYSSVAMGTMRSERARDEVLQATADLVAEVGLERITIDEIAARSGVAKTTIYRHWPSKQALAHRRRAELPPSTPPPRTPVTSAPTSCPASTPWCGPASAAGSARCSPRCSTGQHRDPELDRPPAGLHGDRSLPLRTVLQLAQYAVSCPPTSTCTWPPPCSWVRFLPQDDSSGAGHRGVRGCHRRCRPAGPPSGRADDVNRRRPARPGAAGPQQHRLSSGASRSRRKRSGRRRRRSTTSIGGVRLGRAPPDRSSTDCRAERAGAGASAADAGDARSASHDVADPVEPFVEPAEEPEPVVEQRRR